MILSFPSPCWMFEVRGNIPIRESFQVAHLLTVGLSVTAPISLKPNDHLLIDLQGRRVEIVERDGIAIYRSGWLN